MAEEALRVDVGGLLPGGVLRVENGAGALLLCNVGGRFYAVDERCTHARASLAHGRLDDCVIECPVHGARFDVRDGSVAAPPARRPLNSYPVVVEGRTAEIRVR